VAAATSIGARRAAAGPVSAVGFRPPVWSRTHQRARGNVEALVRDFDECVRRFEASGAFSGPSVYFHERAIERRRLRATVADLLADELLLEYVYAVLRAWGMHRMGNQPAKVCDFRPLAASLRSAAPLIEELWPLNITRLAPGSVPAVNQTAWQIIATIRVSLSETQIVAGSKTLHHVLPDLIPTSTRSAECRPDWVFCGLTNRCNE
jgi:hypothetical protein